MGREPAPPAGRGGARSLSLPSARLVTLALTTPSAGARASELRVRDATIFLFGEKKIGSSTSVRASDAANGRGWSESLTGRDAAERGVRVLAIEAIEDG